MKHTSDGRSKRFSEENFICVGIVIAEKFQGKENVCGLKCSHKQRERKKEREESVLWVLCIMPINVCLFTVKPLVFQVFEFNIDGCRKYRAMVKLRYTII